MKNNFGIRIFAMAGLLGLTIVFSEVVEARRAAQRQSLPPVVSAYKAWVAQGVRAGRFVQRCEWGGEGISYPSSLPSRNASYGKTVYGDLNSDGVTDFIAMVSTLECGVGTAGWHGDIIIGLSQGKQFKFGTISERSFERYFGNLTKTADKFGFLDSITAINRGQVSGLIWDNNTRGVRGYCEGYHGNSNLRRTFTLDFERGVVTSVSDAFVDRTWRCSE